MTMRLGRVPPFPRWTGMSARASGPHDSPEGGLVMTVTVRLTRRARLWARWRKFLGR
ncbi:hypothetical protein [Streptomyces scabiei]|uniref:hypothetical protein n=1 Tax=Streptomyces scabiei TaxID=1930 RepID=UPI000AD4CB77|nr:hypothetical protein [Streptomyces scabiei]MDX3681378.1 hypothetical protein [Streptomyces scabiei]